MEKYGVESKNQRNKQFTNSDGLISPFWCDLDAIYAGQLRYVKMEMNWENSSAGKVMRHVARVPGKKRVAIRRTYNRKTPGLWMIDCQC